MSSNSGAVAAPLRAVDRLSTAAGRLATIIAHLWKAYWEYQARRATVVMLRSLDDRTLADIGLTRSEITSVVFGGRGRPRPYDPHWRLLGVSQDRAP
jgi:uncharacterized protein YjiS (DUF1127 family)